MFFFPDNETTEYKSGRFAGLLFGSILFFSVAYFIFIHKWLNYPVVLMAVILWDIYLLADPGEKNEIVF